MKTFSILALLASSASASYTLQQCDSFCMRKEASDYNDNDWAKLKDALQKFQETNSGAYQELQDAQASYFQNKDFELHLPRIRVWLAKLEDYLREVDSTICIPYFDWSRYYDRVDEAPACQNTRVPDRKNYEVASPEVLQELKNDCKQAPQPYTEFAKQYDIYSTLAASSLKKNGTRDFVLSITQWAYDDKVYSDFQTEVAVQYGGDSDKQYDGDMNTDCGFGKKVRDVLDVRDLCYGYVLAGSELPKTVPASNRKPVQGAPQRNTNNKREVCYELDTPGETPTDPPVDPPVDPVDPPAGGNGTTGGNDTTTTPPPTANLTGDDQPTGTNSSPLPGYTCVTLEDTYKTSPAEEYKIPECPTTFYPTGYEAPTKEPTKCPVNVYFEGYGLEYDAAKYDDTNVSYEELPQQYSGPVNTCYDRQKKVSEKIKNGEDVKINYPVYDEKRAYTGAAALEQTSSASATVVVGLATVLGVVVALL